MEKRRILYELGDSGRDELIFKLANKLQKEMSHVSFFHCGKPSYPFVIKNKINSKNILLLDHENQSKIKNPDLQFLKAAEKKFNFNIWDLWEISAQRTKKRRKIPPKKILIWYEYFIKELNSFLDKNKITDFVIYGPASFVNMIFLKIMEQKKINIIELEPSRFQGKFAIAKNLNRNWGGLKENYTLIKNNKPTKKQREEAVRVLESHKKGEQKPDCMLTYKEPKIKKIKRYLKIGYRMIRTNHFPPTFKPLIWKQIEKVYDHLNIFEKPVAGEKFILFPLHFQPEASTLIHGKWYINQPTLIENIIRSLPVDYKLYVKEHSFGYGNRSLRFYKEIKKYANVRLISPHTSNLELIKKSSLVITITGTTGWEAIMFQKPVIVFGKVFYNIFDCVKKIEKIKELPIIIRELLDTHIDYEEVLICVTAMNESTHPGLAFLPNLCNNHSLKDNNVKLLAQGIKKHITNNLNFNSVKSYVKYQTK